MSAFSLLLPAFIACLILTGIHTYLGIHVIARGVIFVDIALAQIAALGMTVALWAGFPLESETAYFFALGFTALGALFFAFFRDEKIPHEAIIGVSFAVSSAVAVLIANSLAHGSEHLRYLLAGNILWVDWHQIVKTAVIYGILGIVHFFLRRPLLAVSTNQVQAAREGHSPWFWNLIFYLSFGLVITSSVQIAGILLVFSFLIVPALCSLLFCKTLKGRIFFGWILGAIVSLVGIVLSYRWDLPTGPAIVSAFGASLVLCLTAKTFVHQKVT